MKSIKLLTLSSIIILCGCLQQPESPEPNYYRNLFTQEIIAVSEFDKFKYDLFMEHNDSTRGQLSMGIHFFEISVSGDSAIQDFKYSIRIGNEYIVRGRIPEKLGSVISSHVFLTITGDSVQIGGRKEKPTMVNLWHIACVGCVEEMPALNWLQAKYGDKIDFIALTFDSGDAVSAFLGRREFNFRHVANAQAFIDQIGSQPYPENIFIDREGVIRYVEGGLSPDDDFAEVTSYFVSLMEELLK